MKNAAGPCPAALGLYVRPGLDGLLHGQLSSILVDGALYRGTTTASLQVTASRALSGYQFRAMATKSIGTADAAKRSAHAGRRNTGSGGAGSA